MQNIFGTQKLLLYTHGDPLIKYIFENNGILCNTIWSLLCNTNIKLICNSLERIINIVSFISMPADVRFQWTRTPYLQQ